MAITLRNTKGVPLTHEELDGNFIDLNTRVVTLEANLPEDLSELSDTQNLLTTKDYIDLLNRITSDSSTNVQFTKAPNTSSDDVFDTIDTDLVLTRDATGISGQGGGIYNKSLESAWSQTISPQGTEWNLDGWDNLDDITVRFYEPLREVFRNRIGENIVGAKLVMHDTINDKYYKFEFSQWTQGANHDGGFAYTRELINTTNRVGITYPDGTLQVSAPVPFSGFKEVFIGDTSNYDIQPKDAGKYINAFNNTIYVPDDSSYNFPTGAYIYFVASNGPITIEPRNAAVIFGPDGSQTSSWTIPAGTTATIIKTTSNWYITGSTDSNINYSAIVATQIQTNGLPVNTRFIQAPPVTSKGNTGNVAGSVAFDSNYIYYCTTTYTDGVADIWKRVAWSGDTW